MDLRKPILLLLLLLFVLTTSLLAQVKLNEGTYSYKKQSILALHFVANDFTTPEYLQQHSINDFIANWAKLKDMNYGLGLEYFQSLTNHIDFSGRLDASFSKYSLHNAQQPTQNKLLLESGASMNYKLFSDRHFIIPYLHVGIGGSVYNGCYGAYSPLGVGVQLNIGNGKAFLYSNMQYRLRITGNAVNHFNYSIGVGGLLTKHQTSRRIIPSQLITVADSDGDGINDSNDSCKKVRGIAKYKGCPIPDADYDGINDEMDQCPNQPGLAKYNGCPVPDKDGDGINDESDSCPIQPGIAKYNGCPIPDTDNDGVSDEEDKCPTQPGLASNSGCPVKVQIMQQKVDTIAHQIFFATGSAVLLNRSYTALSQLASILKVNDGLGVSIEGHTDNTGSDNMNNNLSLHRAEAVLNYLISQGISKNRLSAKGYGSAIPLADNHTAEGRALNRRVELKLK